MEHGVSWLSFLPFYDALEHALHSVQLKGMLGNPVVAQHVVAALLVVLVVMLISMKARAQLAKASDGGLVPSEDINARNLFEVLFEALFSQMHQIIGKEANRYFPVIATLALFIFFSNILGLIPGFLPPTDNWNTTFACGGFVFLYYNYHGLRVNGIDHLIHMANPAGSTLGWFLAPLMLPIEIVSHIARPLSLGIRLATNMVGDHAVLGAFVGLVPWLIPIPFLALGLLVCCIQTLVFVLLSMVYIGLAVQEAHHDDHHGAEAHA